MKRNIWKFLTAFTGSVCALTVCAAIATSEKTTCAAATAAHALEIFAADFEEKSAVVSSSTDVAGGFQYNFESGAALDMANQSGIAVRVKNLSGGEYTINQFRIFDKNSSLVYSPYNSTNLFYWLGGGISTSSHTARYVKIPKDFDGYMLLPYDQMVVIRNSSGSWIWSENQHLSATGSGDRILPAGQCNQLAFYSLKSTVGKELMIGAHSSYLAGEDGTVSLGAQSVKIDLATAMKPGSTEPLMNNAYATSLTCNFTGDERVKFASESLSVPYGYELTVPALFEKGYRQDKVVVGTGDAATVQSTLEIQNGYKQNTTLPVSVTSKAIGLDSSARILDPDDGEATGNNYGGAWAFEQGIFAGGADGVVFRVRNTLRTEYLIDTFYLNGENGVQYSLLNSTLTYVGIDGVVSTHCPGNGATLKTRTAHIPALFDGYMVVPFSELVATHVDSKIDGAYNWNRFENNKLQKTASDVWNAYPSGKLTGVNVYFRVGNANEGVNELIFGTAGTYAGEAAAFRLTNSTAFKSTTSSLVGGAGGTVAISAYPETTTSLTLKVNGKTGVSDEAISLETDQSEVTLGYGQALCLSPKTSLGYALSKIVLSGDQSEVLTSPLFINLDREGGVYEINFVTEETTSFTLGTQNISFADKNALKVNVDNTSGEKISYRVVLTDGEKQYIASSSGAGIYEKDGTVTYGDVFSIPAGYKGSLYIPFNVWRGTAYGGRQNLPFNYSQGEKPAEVTGKVYFDCLTGQSKEVLTAAFTGWEYVADLPALSKAKTDNADLYEEGDADFIGGILIDPLSTLAASSAGSAKAVRMTPEQTLSFADAGFAFRVKNISGADFGIRAYFAASDNKTYVPAVKNAYTRIDKNGTAEDVVDSNRNMIIPKDFDGTVLLSFADYATDTVVGGVTQNILRDGLTVKYMNFYSAGTAGKGLLLGKCKNIGYDGNISASTMFASTTVTDVTTGGAFALKSVSPLSVTTENLDATISPASVIFGSSTVTVSPKAGEILLSVTAEGCKTTDNGDGTFDVNIVYDYTSSVQSFVLSVASDSALTVSVTAGEKGKVEYQGQAVEGEIVVPANAAYSLTIIPDAGYEAVVKAGDTLLTASADNVYTFPAGTAAATVAFNRLQAELTATVGENGTATLKGAALADGKYTLDQGENYILTLSPALGYVETVMLGGEKLEKTENGYEIVLSENSTLTVSFAAIEYQITYRLDRGANGNNPATYTVNDAVTFVGATKEGYTFVGWYTLQGEEKTSVTGIAKGSTGDITVYAEFTLNAVTPSGAESGCGSAIRGLECVAMITSFGAAILLKKKTKRI